MPNRRASVVSILLLALGTAPAFAQCDPTWLPGPAVGGPDQPVHALVAAPNGDVFAAGSFVTIDGVAASHVAQWNGSAWSALGSGTNGAVSALVRLPNGTIVAGGAFTTAGGAPASNIAAWSGTAWSGLGAGTNGAVSALLVLPNGDLIAGGNFTSAGGAPAARVARWSNGAWSPLGLGFSGGAVLALERLLNGDIVAGGTFGTLGRWNGTAWSSLGTLQVQTIRAFALAPNGDLFIGGNGMASVVRWNGASFLALPTYAGGTARALRIDSANGDLVIAGVDLAIGVYGVLRWNGTALTAVGVTGAQSHALAPLPNGGLVACVDAYASQSTRAVQRWDGSNWTTLGVAPPPVVVTLAAMPSGDVVAGGVFEAIAGVPMRNIARWNPTSGWSPLGSGVQGSVFSLAAASNGDLIVGGAFTAAGGAPTGNVARWNGSAWSTIGAGISGTAPLNSVVALTTRPNGEILAMLGNSVERWNGSTWSTLAGVSGQIRVAGTLPNGDVLFAGDPHVPGITSSSVVRWDGATFSALGPATSSIVRALLLRRNGDILIGGFLEPSPSSSFCTVARWTGSAWAAFGNSIIASAGTVYALAELPNGDVVASGSFSTFAGQPVANIARWNGSTWSAIDGGVNGSTVELAASQHGELFAAGLFTQAGTSVSVGIARTDVPCPGAVSTFGAGCTSTAGPVTLSAANTPFAGGTFASTATGMTPQSLALHVFGLNPIAQPLPLGAPGCSLFVDPIATELLVPSAGIATAAFAIPNAPSLAGAALRTQVVGVELTAGGALLRLTSTNALLLTIGAL